jgi:hypothetical protein
MRRSVNRQDKPSRKNSTTKRLRGLGRRGGVSITRQFRRLPVANRSQLEWLGTGALIAPVALRTIQPLSRPAIIANKNFFSHLRLVSTASGAACQTLFAENFFYVSHFFLDFPAYFLRRAAILQVRIARGPARLFLNRSLSLLHTSLDLVLRARLHTNESSFPPDWAGSYIGYPHPFRRRNAFAPTTGALT